MKRKISLLPALVVIAVLAGTPISGNGPSNLIQNGNFDLGRTNWQFFTNGTGSFLVAGKKATLITKKSGTNVQLFQKDLILQPGSSYRLTLTLSEPARGSNMRISIHEHAFPHTNYGLNVPVDVKKTPTTHVFDFDTPDFPLGPARLQLQMGQWDAPKSRYMIDNVVLEVTGF